MRSEMSDAEFWEHVFRTERPFDGDEDGGYDSFIVEAIAEPCPECYAVGACGYDELGRAMIHVTEDLDAGN